LVYFLFKIFITASLRATSVLSAYCIISNKLKSSFSCWVRFHSLCLFFNPNQRTASSIKLFTLLFSKTESSLSFVKIASSMSMFFSWCIFVTNIHSCFKFYLFTSHSYLNFSYHEFNSINFLENSTSIFPKASIFAGITLNVDGLLLNITSDKSERLISDFIAFELSTFPFA